MSDPISFGAVVMAPLVQSAVRSVVSTVSTQAATTDPLVSYPAEPSVGTTDEISHAGAVGGAADFSYFIAEQQRVQREMLEVTLVSNVMKSRHETEMAPVRNVRVA